MFLQTNLHPSQGSRVQNSSDESYVSDAALQYINKMLMEEDFEHHPCMFQDCMALQVASKSLHDALNRDDNLAGADKEEKYNSKTRKNRRNNDNDFVEGGRSYKFLAATEEQIDDQLMFDQILLSNNGIEYDLGAEIQTTRGKKSTSKYGFTDLSAILFHCAQAVGSNNLRVVNEKLKQIREHSSPFGDPGQRLAHYFADGLEARMVGNGVELYSALASGAHILRAYTVHLKTCPFIKISYFLATETIEEVSAKATRLHIIDFGILYGYQWPALIQRLSVRPGGPPKLRITGIDLPQRGFRPAGRVAETGRRLAKCCEQFNVLFEYTAIAKKWEDVRVKDLKIDGDEVTIVNCMYRLRNVPDETVSEKSARDTVLKLIMKINPDVFVHAVRSGSYNIPYFVTRFKAALYHYSAMFDMLEANVSREDEERVAYEKELLGKDVMNVIACEGSERVERPETYRQWEARSVRAGLRPLRLKDGVVEQARTMVKLNYHKDFLVDQDGGWMLQGWKGRIFDAISCWKRA